MTDHQDDLPLSQLDRARAQALVERLMPFRGAILAVAIFVATLCAVLLGLRRFGQLAIWGVLAIGPMIAYALIGIRHLARRNVLALLLGASSFATGVFFASLYGMLFIEGGEVPDASHAVALALKVSGLAFVASLAITLFYAALMKIGWGSRL